VKRGAILLVGLDPTLGHEQQGVRPCLVLGDTAMAQHQRFPLVVVAPLTSTPLRGPLYPGLAASAQSGLKQTSYVLLDQLRSIDKRRVLKAYGSASKSELAAIDQGLRALLGL
jgi:mRNA interferase MazF